MADESKEDTPDSPDVHFEPVVKVKPVVFSTLEEDEEQMIKLRAKLFRYDNDEDPPEWKERGTGEVKLLHHKINGTVRVLMRRDKTLKICANHYVLPHMELVPNCGSERAWVWSTPSDFADEEEKSEILSLRFANAENAQKFKDKFEEAKTISSKSVIESPPETNGSVLEKSDSGTDSVTDKLSDLTVKENVSGDPEYNANHEKPESGTDSPKAER